MFFEFIILGFLFAAGIGPVNIETAKRGLIGQSLRAFVFYLGNALVDGFYILVIIFGFSFITENTILKVILAIFGIGYLGYLGIGNIKDFYIFIMKKKIYKQERQKRNPSFFIGFTC